MLYQIAIRSFQLRVALFLLLLSSLPEAIALAQESIVGPPITPQERILLDDATLHDVAFVGPEIGYAVGNRGCIRKTTDGGQTWKILPTPVACNWESVVFLTDQIGWVAGGVVAVDGRTSQGCILATRDGGATWQIQAPVGLGYLKHLQFFDLSQGVVCGESTSKNPSGIWQTADGGKTWTGVVHTQQYRWLGGHFAEPNSGVLVGEQGQIALLGGNRLFVDPSLNLGSKSVTAVTIDDTAKGWIVGDGGLIRFSPGGASWQDPATEIPESLRRIFDFRTVTSRGDRVWIAGHPGSSILLSEDAGQSWQIASNPSSAPLNAITFVDDQTGYAVGELGTIVKTTDGGRSWNLSAGGIRRLALLQYSSVPEEASLSLTARYSGHHGYRTGVIAMCKTEGAEIGEYASAPLRLEAAQQHAGGNITSIRWTLPLDLPQIREHQPELITRWNRATDGQLSEYVLTHLVRDIRTYRPTVLVIDSPEPHDHAGLLIQQAVENAVRMAADVTAMPDLQSQAMLAPWQVSRLVLRNRAGQGGDLVLDNNDYLTGLQQSVRSAASPSYRLIQPGQVTGPLFESYSISKQTPIPQNLRLNDFFTGIVLGPGSDARRALIVLEGDDTKGEAIARRQRNQAAFLKRDMHNEMKAGRTIAQLNDFIAGMTPQQATVQLYEVANEYKKNHDWDFFESVLMKIVEDFPAHPLAATAAVDLIQLWGSQEMRALRLEGRQATQVRQQVDQNQLRNDLNNIRPASGEFAEETPSPIVPAFVETEVDATVTPGSQQDQSSWNTTWTQRAVSLYQFLQKNHPNTASTAEVQFPIASLLRSQGATRGSNELYSNYLVGDNLGENQIRNPRLAIAELEFWLQSRTGLPPNRFSICHYADEAPRLDAELTEDCWKTAEELRLTSTLGNPQVMNATSEETPIVLCTFDDTYFYIAASCPRREGLPDNLPIKGERHYDADLSGYDRMQFAIDVDRDYFSSCVFEVDQRGLTHDRCGDDPTWNPEWYVACDGDQSHWRVEIAIPRSQLETSGPSAQEPVWSVAITRILPAQGIQSWSGQKQEELQLGSYGWLQLKK